ncbi:hypothetical protein ROZALSC1DRAFT_28297 [Rozella allomycis CSF55]|uniref:Protein kinase domain-containing protein n=1 Tax=Rozella allomycis (strain CSF55) TaxID=988480 RepID=A0A4P9YKQ1_ROZAC|nr:hypothetical protein ROZALSC1DRAFT_28297 [Rozella allomycis CSF55]
MKPSKSSIDVSEILAKYNSQCECIHGWNVLSSPFVEDEYMFIMERSYISFNLENRLGTRPFLEKIEKKWILFQLLKAVSSLHNKNIVHGDIKSENVLISTGGWAYLSDIGNYKPTFLPENNPSDFYLFFDASEKRSCCIAPERFFNPSSHKESAAYGFDLKKAMDIFSLG